MLRNGRAGCRPRSSILSNREGDSDLPVLLRLRRSSDATESAIRRAMAALDRLDVELN